jgi:hypothetical protein
MLEVKKEEEENIFDDEADHIETFMKNTYDATTDPTDPGRRWLLFYMLITILLIFIL